MTALDTDAKYLFFLDNDAYLTEPDYIEKMVKFLEEREFCAFVFGRVLNPDGSDQWFNLYGLNDTDSIELCGSFNGTGVLLKRDLFLNVLGYDPLLFAYYLEPDLSARLYDHDYYGVYMPLKSIHEQTSKSRDNSAMLYYMIRNHYIFCTRWLPLRYALLQMVKWIGWSVVKGWRHPITIVRAHIDYLRLLPKLLKERKPTKASEIICQWNRALR